MLGEQRRDKQTAVWMMLVCGRAGSVVVVVGEKSGKRWERSGEKRGRVEYAK